MSAPPPPPRPPQQPQQPQYPQQQGPPVPPLPTGWNTAPHFGDPLVAPRPQKLSHAEMARSLEQQMPSTPAPPGGMPYGQGVPSISFNTPPMPGAYPQANQYQGAPYNQAYNQAPYRGTTPMPYPGTPQPYQRVATPLGFGAPPPNQFGTVTPPNQPFPPPNAGLTPSYVPQARPMSWGGPPTPQPQPLQPPNARPISSYNLSPQQPLRAPSPGAQPPPASLQQGLNAISQIGVMPPPNPNWINGATPPVSRPASAQPNANRYNIDNSVAGLTFSDPPPRSTSLGPPQLIVQLPTVASLAQSMPAVLQSRDPAGKVLWAKDVLSALDRAIQATGASVGEDSARELLKPQPGAAMSQQEAENDAALLQLAERALRLLVELLQNPGPVGPQGNMQPWVAEGLFLRGQAIAAGSFPDILPKSPRDAFRDFEASARGGYAPAWFKLGRDYETVGDLVRAKDCFERGVQRGVGSCLYRMGMAHLQGQLGISQNPSFALPLLRQAAFLSSIEVPQPAYVYALLLQNEFPHITLPPQLLQSMVPPHPPLSPQGIPQSNVPPLTLQSESRKYLERSAYLGFGPALYKLGQSYEHALPPFPYDPLMSVQYYSLASQQGDALADLALSKWFLVGSNPGGEPNSSEGFDKDENLALIFAEKAASKGEAGGEFAMGFYCETGVGRPVDLNAAKGWYERAAKQGNAEAIARLKELARENPVLLGTGEAKGRLERMRTNAAQRGKQNAASQPQAPPMPDHAGSSVGGGGGLGVPGMSGANVVAMARSSSRVHHAGSGKWGKNKVEEFTVPPVPSLPANTTNMSTPPIAPKPAAHPVGAATAASAASKTETKPAETKPASTASGAKKPATFEEMGIYSQKLEDEKCIIM